VESRWDFERDTKEINGLTLANQIYGCPAHGLEISKTYNGEFQLKMASPPSGEPGSPATSSPQPLPHQPQPTQTKPSSSGSKKTRQRKQAVQKNPSPAASSGIV
jgi:hypothetical protein